MSHSLMNAIVVKLTSLGAWALAWLSHEERSIANVTIATIIIMSFARFIVCLPNKEDPQQALNLRQDCVDENDLKQRVTGSAIVNKEYERHDLTYNEVCPKKKAHNVTGCIVFSHSSFVFIRSYLQLVRQPKLPR